MTIFNFHITRRRHHIGDGVTNLRDEYPLNTTNIPQVIPSSGSWPMPKLLIKDNFSYDSYITGFDNANDSLYLLNPDRVKATLDGCKVSKVASKYQVINDGKIYVSSEYFLYRQHLNYNGDDFDACKEEATKLISKLVTDKKLYIYDWNVYFFTNITSGGVPLYIVFYPGNDSNAEEIVSITV